MNTILASRTLALDVLSDLAQALRSMIAGRARKAPANDESSTKFSWPRGL